MSPDDELHARVSRLWDEHMRTAFPPRLRGEELAGVDIVMLDADVAGGVSTWMGNGGSLDAARANVLTWCLSDIDRVLPQLTETEAPYFERLQTLAKLILGAR